MQKCSHSPWAGWSAFIGWPQVSTRGLFADVSIPPQPTLGKVLGMEPHYYELALAIGPSWLRTSYSIRAD
jgi:hypothetical protein